VSHDLKLGKTRGLKQRIGVGFSLVFECPGQKAGQREQFTKAEKEVVSSGPGVNKVDDPMCVGL